MHTIVSRLIPFCCLAILTVVISHEAMAASAENSPPSLPLTLTATPRSASHFLLEWSGRIADGTQIRIRRRYAGHPWIDLATVTAGTTAHESVGCLAETTYEHQLTTGTGDGTKMLSAIVRATTPKADATMRGRLVYDTHCRQGDGSLLKIGRTLYSIHQITPAGGHDKSAAHIVLMYSRDDGRTWSKELTLFKEATHHTKHPAVLKLPDGRIAATYTRYNGGHQGGKWSAHRVFRVFPKAGLKVSKLRPEILADADNWSPICRITDDSWIYQGGLHDRMRLLSDGSLITAVLASDGKKPRKIGTNIYKLPARRLKDPDGHWQRKTPQRIYVGGRSGFVESTIEEWDPTGHPGHLLCLGRTEKGRFYQCRSSDYGETWSKPVPSSIRAPIAPPYLRRIPDTSTIVLIWNPYVAPESKGNSRSWHGGDRWILASMVSDDGGHTWRNYRQIEYDRDPKNWYAYVDLCFDGDTVHMSYRRWRRDKPSDPPHGAMIYRKLQIDWFTAE